MKKFILLSIILTSLTFVMCSTPDTTTETTNDSNITIPTDQIVMIEKSLLYEVTEDGNIGMISTSNTYIDSSKVDSVIINQDNIYYRITYNGGKYYISKTQTMSLYEYYHPESRASHIEKSTSSPSSSSSTHTYQTGPRGGQYYINSKGNKVYKKKKK